MSINKTYAVLGLGRYGAAVAKELVANGAEVLAVDKNQSIVDDLAGELPLCKCADITDPAVIKQLGIENIDVAIVSMANNIEASVMAITLCKEAGVKTVIAKSAIEIHGKIFTRVGADQVVLPEQESGMRLAKNLLSAGFVDMIELSQDVSMVEIDVLEKWVGKNLVELKLREKYELNVVAIKKEKEVIIAIDPFMPLEAAAKLIVIAKTDKLAKLYK